jgi:hypothetical protein
MDVLGWRFPPTDPDAAHQQALDIAKIVSFGLDGFVVDPEGDSRLLFNWDAAGLESVATDYCNTIKAANPNLHFGLTSHYLAAKPFPSLPWATFVQQSKAFYPQAYWRVQTDRGPLSVGKGVDQNYHEAITSWEAIGASKTAIVPMAGELRVSHPDEISQYTDASVATGVNELHFYAHEPTGDQSVWDAIRQI